MAKTRMESVPSSSEYSLSGEEREPLLSSSGTRGHGVQGEDGEYEKKKTGAKWVLFINKCRHMKFHQHNHFNSFCILLSSSTASMFVFFSNY